MKILGIDPSISLTAAALLVTDPAKPNLGRLQKYWTIRPKGEQLGARVLHLAEETGEVIDQAKADVIVVELPANRPMGQSGFARRSVLDLPNYGMAVGAVLLASEWCGKAAHGGGPDRAFQLLTPSVCDWVGRDVPSSKGDEHKTERVKHAARLYGCKPEDLGTKTVAGNVADAIYLARWGLWRVSA